MTEVTVEVKIGGRTYPLKVDESEQEGMKTAAKRIETKMKEFHKLYAVRDEQDLIAMTALYFASDNENISLKQTEPEHEKLISQIDLHFSEMKNKLQNELT